MSIVIEMIFYLHCGFLHLSLILGILFRSRSKQRFYLKVLQQALRVPLFSQSKLGHTGNSFKGNSTLLPAGFPRVQAGLADKGNSGLPGKQYLENFVDLAKWISPQNLLLCAFFLKSGMRENKYREI